MVRGVAKVMQISTEESFLGMKYCSPGRVQNASKRPILACAHFLILYQVFSGSLYFFSHLISTLRKTIFKTRSPGANMVVANQADTIHSFSPDKLCLYPLSYLDRIKHKIQALIGNFWPPNKA